jgi:ArsR family transcriptional regulator
MGCSVVRPALAISPATLSHHIKELEAAGLIHVERQGKFHFLALRPGVLEALAATIASLTPMGATAARTYPNKISTNHPESISQGR